MDLYQQYIHKSRYARWDYDKKRRENWDETVMRYVNFMENHLKENCNYILEDDLKKEMFQYIYEQKVMPSMRALMTAGKALERENLSQFNCSYMPIDSIRAFDEAMYILMCGVGLGYSVERQYISKLPEVPDELYDTDTVIVVADSKLGWAKAYKELIAMLYAGQIPKWDTSKIRPAGAPLKVFGGRASGPQALVDIFKNTINVFKKAVGRKLNSAECSDIMCYVAKGIIVGGVRRSALICLSNLSDERMRNYKTGQWWVENPQRALANISVAYTEKPEIGVFMKEWQSLYESKSGERGIFNRVAVKKQLLEKCPDRDSNADYGVNPCIVGDTLIAVADDRGYVPIKTLVDNGEDNIPVLCFNKVGKVVVRNMINPRITQKNAKVYNVEFMDTKSVSVTSNHKFLTASGKYKSVNDLKPGDELISYEDNDINNKDIRNIRRECKLYGDAIDKFNEFSENELIDNFNKAKHYFPDNNISIKDNKVYITKQCESCEKEYDVEYGNHEVCFCSDKCYKKYYSEKKDTQFIDKKYIVSEIEWRGKVNYSRLKIRNITFIGKQDVYNGTVEEYHNYFTEPCSSYGISGYSGYYSLVNNANCGEIILKQIYQSESSKEGNKSSSIGGGLCNLSEVVCRENDTYEDLKSKVRMATIFGTFQSSLTDFKYIRKGWKTNAEDERLLGVSLTGVMDCNLLNKVCDETKELLTNLRLYAEEVNKEFAKKIGINKSKALGCLKPAGSTSQLNNTSSGLHSRFSKYYLRTVRNDSKDPLSKFMKENGFYYEQDKMNPTNDVFYFPIKSPDNCILAKDENAIQQLEKYLMFKNYWCHHNPSITVYVKEHEWLEVAAFVYKNFDDIIGVTFLPYSDHIYEQAPYQEIDEETYIKWLEKMPKEINWGELSKYEEKDYTTSSQELSCFGGACEINF